MDTLSRLEKLRDNLIRDEKLKQLIQIAENHNPWFVPVFVKEAMDSIVDSLLAPSVVSEWLRNYGLKKINKTVGLICAGNIPLVGFHDLLCCYVTGCRVQLKLSSRDDVLMLRVAELMKHSDPDFAEGLQITDKLQDIDAVIATGSDNTNRYFEYYFRKYPSILRKNRNSVAVLTGNETEADLNGLADDIFMYFGFGCRNVSKLYVPVGYDVRLLFPHFTKYNWLHHHTKYMNNYDYQRTILLMNRTPHLANEFVMLLENKSISSPIATLHYEYWHDKNILSTHLKDNQDNIQCIVSSTKNHFEFCATVKFGNAQRPGPSDYADSIDTIAFLLNLD